MIVWKARNSTSLQGFLAIGVDCEVENTRLLLMTCCILIKNQTTTYKIKHPTWGYEKQTLELKPLSMKNTIKLVYPKQL